MNCIDLAIKAAGGKLTDKEIADAFEQEGKIREALIASGKIDNLEMRVARQIETLALEKKVEAARMKRQIAQNIRARARLDSKIDEFNASGMSTINAIKATWYGTQKGVAGARESGDGQGRAFEAKWLGSAMSAIEKERPHVRKLMANRAFDDAVTREMWELREGGTPGITKNSDAQFVAKVLSSHMEVARTELNSLGAAIGKLDGYAGPQVHDDIAMLKVSGSKWADDVLPLLDIDRSFPDAADEAEVRGILSSVYDTIITGVSNDVTPLLRGQRVGPANLAKKLGKHRVLHFKDADAAIKYRDTYGRGSTIQGIFATMAKQARTAGAMDMYGPNPKAMIGAIAAKRQKALKDKIEGMEPGKARDKLIKEMNDLSAADGEVSRLKAMVDDITGLQQRPVSITAATIGDNIRAWQAMAKLGGAVITAIPSDTVTMAASAMFRGQGFWKGMSRTFGELANGKDGRHVGFLIGEGFDGLAGHLASSYADGVPGTMSRLTQTFFKWSGLSGWTDAARAASARVIAAHLGENAGKAFDDIDQSLRYVLNLNGITAVKWDAMRAGGVRQVNGHTYLTPDAVRYVDESLIEATVADEVAAIREQMLKPTKAGNITENMQAKFDAKRDKIIKRARRDLELDLHRYYADETSYAVVETDAASRQYSTFGTRPGTPPGEALRYLMQFKGFPIAFTQRILGRAIRNAPRGKTGQAAHIAALLSGLTVAGYMAMTAKDAARGLWPPRDPTDPKTLGAAMMQGGALGLYGDFLFGTRSRFGSGPLESLTGPTMGTAQDIFKAWQDAREGNPKAGTYLDIAINNTPYINLFYTRTALDVLFLNQLRETFKPGYLARQETNTRKDRGQEFIVPRTLGDF
jgi:hypothetical protein